MALKRKYNRRFFIKSVFAGLTIGLIALWDKMILTQKKIIQKQNFTFPFDENKEISFTGDFIIINKEEEIKVYSSRCTHLGCKINSAKNGELLCPCHGSTFDLNGNPTKGPAIINLEQKKFKLDNNNITITT